MGTTARAMVVGFSGLLCMGAAPSSPPQAGQVALSYFAIKECPQEDAFRERVADMYDFDDAFLPPGTLGKPKLVVDVHRWGSGYRALVSLLDPDDNETARTWERDTNCNALVYLVAHRMRMVFAPHAKQQQITPQHDKEQDERMERMERMLQDQKRTDDAQKRMNDAQERALDDQRKRLLLLEKRLKESTMLNLTYTLSAGLLMTANLTSDVGPGVWLGGDLRAGPLSLGLELRSALPARFEVGPYDFDLSHYVALLTPCGRYSVFFGCAVAGAGFEAGHDSDINLAPGEPRTHFTPLIQIGGRIGVEIPLGESRFAIRGFGDVLYSAPPSQYFYGNDAYVRDRPDVSVFIGLGLVVKLGDQQAGAN